MTSEQIRKLLGGYATNTLTEAERKSLFDAALDDQELFDALHQEQALKDLLADPISREQVRQALEKGGDTGAPWWSRWWTWTGAAAAVAATVMIVAITRPPAHMPTPVAAPQSKSEAAGQPAEKLERAVKAEDAKVAEPAPPPAAKPARARLSAALRAERKDVATISQPPANAAAPSAQPVTSNQPPASREQVQVTDAAQSAPVQVQTRASDTQALAQQAQSTYASALRDKEQDQVSAGLLKSGLAPISYRVLRRDSNGVDKPLTPGAELKAGDMIRFTIVPAISGYLFLDRREPSGAWTRVFPQPVTGLRVTANASTTIPDSPITVTDTDQNLRIAVTPTQTAGFSKSEKKAKASVSADEAAQAPLIVNLVIGPKRIP